MGSAAVAYGAPCADGSTDQTFYGGMVGCAGAATWNNRAALCGPGYHPASANEWRSLFGGLSPAHNYWTNDDLQYGGSGSSSCSALYTGGVSCGANQPMRVCTPSGTDPEGNACNWTNCGMGATTPNAYFGGCFGNTTAGTVCVPDGCADGTIEQSFSRGMVGCAGKVSWDNRATLCSAGYRVANAEEWVNLRRTTAPSHNYWTNDNLQYGGAGSSSCTADLSGNSCGANQPMRVCTAGGTDAEGNACNWTNCGFGYTTPNQYFGGCVGNTTAGAVCVPVEGCADGSVEQVFANGVVGCAGTATWANRESLCAPGWVAAGSEDWTSAFSSVAPSHNYWTNEDLRYSGSGTSSCSVSSTTGNQCVGSPMRVCTPGGTDAEGNLCNWTHCGLNATTPDSYFGGCAGNLSAGTLCLKPAP